MLCFKMVGGSSAGGLKNRLSRDKVKVCLCSRNKMLWDLLFQSSFPWSTFQFVNVFPNFTANKMMEIYLTGRDRRGG